MNKIESSKYELAVVTTISQRTKLGVVKETERVELVKFNDDTYRSLSNDTITSLKSIY